MSRTSGPRPSLVDERSAAPKAAKPRGALSGLFESRRQALMAIGAGIGILVACVLTYRQLVGTGPALENWSLTRVMIDSQTEEVFPKFRVKVGATVPYTNPKTGAATLYPAEACYWTTDGKAKVEPDYVFLKEYLGQPGPTTCKVCGHRVVPHNPAPPVALMQEAMGHH